MPVDVEIIAVARGRAVFQNVRQQAVVGVKRHVVGDDVLDPSHAGGLTLAGKGLPVVPRPQFGVQGVGIHAVVPVRTARTGAEDGRGIDVRNPKFGQVGHDAGGLGEAEFRAQLQSVGGDGVGHWRRSCHGSSFRGHWECQKHPAVMPAATGIQEVGLKQGRSSLDSRVKPGNDGPERGFSWSLGLPLLQPRDRG